ncbi:uncharacterized protein DUF5017 [Flavobacteriaceae bacterium MAR_2010_72]|nr:uncharacterized protein DUF5017 [Flavobacteriaceae bacterium MAR_2010_72]TVZ58985.1 uncharacterized protein DUF5017 [Flavobacteriaceae bacterium MAR_2010_105]
MVVAQPTSLALILDFKTVYMTPNVTQSSTITTYLIGVMALFVTSCVQDDDYSIPKSLGIEENRRLEALLNSSTSAISIAQLKQLFVPGETTEIISDIYVKGYVTSSDASGNFYKEFYIQDAPENPTAAIKVALNQTFSYNQFNQGREVYIALKGLFIGEIRTNDGVITIGGISNADNEVEAMTAKQIPEHIFRSTNTETITPLNIPLSLITNKHIGMLITSNNVELISGHIGKHYVEPTADFDTQRTLQSCSGFNYFYFGLETSVFADFKQEILPSGNGSITGIVTKTFNGSNLVLVLNDLNGVNLKGERCSLLNPSNFSILISEDFQSSINNANVNITGWTNFAEAGTRVWRVITTSDSGNSGSKIASMGAFNSGQESNIAWLISPSINLDAQGLEFLNFQSSNSFSDNSELEVLISTNWDGTTGNISSANWTALPAAIVSDSEYFQNWVDSGLVDLSGYSGTAYIAFKYIGGDNAANNFDGNYEIDNFKILVQN